MSSDTLSAIPESVQSMRLHSANLTAFGTVCLKRHLRVQVPISTNPILPTPGESGLLLETIQIRITIDPEPRNVRRAMEVRQTPLALSYHGTNTDVAGCQVV